MEQGGAVTEQQTSEDWRGKIGALERDELDAFLREGHLMRLACIGDDGWPYVVPCWHEWEDGAWWVIPRRRSVWATYLEREPKCGVTVDEAGRQRRVVAQCLAELVERPNVDGQWLPIAERMARRYLGENGPKYLIPTLDKPRWLFRLRPVHLKTWQGVGWASRYG